MHVMASPCIKHIDHEKPGNANWVNAQAKIDMAKTWQRKGNDPINLFIHNWTGERQIRNLPRGKWKDPCPVP